MKDWRSKRQGEDVIRATAIRQRCVDLRQVRNNMRCWEDVTKLRCVVTFCADRVEVVHRLACNERRTRER